MPTRTFQITLTTGDVVAVGVNCQQDWKAEARRIAENGVCDEENGVFYSARHIVSMRLGEPAPRIIRTEPRRAQRRWFPLGQQETAEAP